MSTYSVSVYYLLRIEELTCGGMVEQVQEAFGETMTSVVSLCARYPIACANSIGLLCTIPYTRQETSPSSLLSLRMVVTPACLTQFVVVFFSQERRAVLGSEWFGPAHGQPV